MGGKPAGRSKPSEIVYWKTSQTSLIGTINLQCTHVFHQDVACTVSGYQSHNHRLRAQMGICSGGTPA
jgi:hypothetical protein